MGGNGGDVCNVVAFFKGWDRVDVQDDTGNGRADLEYQFAKIVGDKADFHADLNIGTTLHKWVPNARVVGEPEKALGHGPQIDPWLTPHNRRAGSVSKLIGVVATKVVATEEDAAAEICLFSCVHLFRS